MAPESDCGKPRDGREVNGARLEMHGGIARSPVAILALVALLTFAATGRGVDDDAKYDPAAAAEKVLHVMNVRPSDSPQFGVSHYRNNVSAARNIPTEWDVKSGRNIKWSAKLGSLTYSTPVVANGKVFVGTNNGARYVRRFPTRVDLGVLLCFEEETGIFLWQHSNQKLAAGRVNDWEQVGICSAPCVEGDRLWYVTNRDEVVCLDTEGFHDRENDGPFQDEPNEHKDEADVVWTFDLIGEFGVFPHNSTCCSVTIAGDTLFVSTSNGVDAAHRAVANPMAPSFLAMNKKTGQVLWSDNSPGENILHGQWSSPAYGILGGIAQVIFAGGDGWVYSFDPEGDNGKSKLLWKFDCNPKASRLDLVRGLRNPLIATPVIYDGLVYIAVGEDPEHGEGPGRLWCVDPTHRGDVSSTQVFNEKAPDIPLPPRRLQALNPAAGDFERMNENSALVWHYEGDNPQKFEDTMHRTLSNTTIKDDLLFINDESGLVHCVDAKNGTAHWVHDMLASSWSTPLIAGDRVYVTNLDGTVLVFKLSKTKQIVSELSLDIPIYGTPVVANGILYIAAFNTLFAIAEGAESGAGSSRPEQSP